MKRKKNDINEKISAEVPAGVEEKIVKKEENKDIDTNQERHEERETKDEAIKHHTNGERSSEQMAVDNHN